MTQPPTIGDTIAGNIFSHFEQERTFLRHDIARIVNDGITLGAAAGQATPVTDEKQLFDAAVSLCKTLVSDMSLLQGLSPKIRPQLDQLYLALRQTGWRP